jgi:hypothetical protein
MTETLHIEAVGETRRHAIKFAIQTLEIMLTNENMPGASVSMTTGSASADWVPDRNPERDPFRIAKIVGEWWRKYECRDWVDAYAEATTYLVEEPRNQWTPDDAIDAILRATQITKTEQR